MVVLATTVTPLGVANAAPATGKTELTITVSESGDTATDGTFTLSCNPVGGDHWAGADACKRLDTLRAGGMTGFPPVPPDAWCTHQYGGPATAHIQGTWAGRKVDAVFDRNNGCEISRWDRLVPVLPQPPQA
ncbi:SSI family serine proteinase inhibitor [Nocardia brasiliensis]